MHKHCHRSSVISSLRRFWIFRLRNPSFSRIHFNHLSSMAIEQLIKKGEIALQDRDYLESISLFSKCIKENPKAFQPYLKRSIAYQRLKNYDRAKSDISEAFSVAEDRGKRKDIGECYYRLGLVFYSEKDYKMALKNFERAKEYDCSDPALGTWLSKCELDLKKTGDEKEEKEQKEENNQSKEDITPKHNQTIVNDTPASSTDINTINKQAPIKQKIKDEWYQSNEEVTLTIYAKNVNPDTFSIDFTKKSLNVTFPNGPNAEYNYTLEPLYDEIDSTKSSHRIFGTKIEIYLVKKQAFRWPTLERSDDQEEIIRNKPDDKSDKPLSYPSSSKKAINWDKLDIDDNQDQEEQNQSENDFFAKLFKDADDETKRAMMKSYVQSNGTVLTTNWEEAKEKEFETSPPEGMEARKWH